MYNDYMELTTTERARIQADMARAQREGDMAKYEELARALYQQVPV